MLVTGNKDEIRALAQSWRTSGERVGLVPTMGALHEGHLSLVRLSKAACTRTVVTIFVNPTQFGPGEDLSKYPRTLENDCAMLEAEGVDAVFAPPDGSMYLQGHASWVLVERLTAGLCGASRPTHFRGVTTIVSKLFNIIQPHEAFFGQKDYQQAAVIRRMTLDLDMPVSITVGPIVREADGLAMSSRNRFLSGEQRQAAGILYRALSEVYTLAEEGSPLGDCLEHLRTTILSQPLAELDYAAIVDADSLEPVEDLSRPAVAALAVRFGTTRLIDNMLLPPGRSGGS